QRRCWSAANRAIASGVLSSIPVVSLPPTGAAKACERAPTSNATRPYSMFVLLLDAGRMLPGSPTPHMSRHTLVTRAQGPVTLSVLANGAGSRSTDEVRPEPASGSARLPRENPTTRPPGQAGITYKERLQPRPYESGRTARPRPPHIRSRLKPFLRRPGTRDRRARG